MRHKTFLKLFYFLNSELRSGPKSSIRQIQIRFLLRLYRRAASRQHVVLNPATAIGQELHLAHGGFGVVVSKYAVLGDRVQIMPLALIGSNIDADGNLGAAPVIGNDVFIGAGAAIIGRTTIGNGARIGAGVVLTNATVPPNTRVFAPAPIMQPMSIAPESERRTA